MKVIENINVYKCDFCKKISTSKGRMKLHENACKKNPINQSDCAGCLLCEHTCESVEYESDYHDDNGDTSIRESLRTTFTCKADGKKMYHRKVLRFEPKRRQEILSRCDKMMPTYNTCDMIQRTNEHYETIQLSRQ